jgi:hypothetical protein
VARDVAPDGAWPAIEDIGYNYAAPYGAAPGVVTDLEADYDLSDCFVYGG